MGSNFIKLPRIFIGLTEVSGYYANLKKGFNELGVKCEHIAIQKHQFAYADSGMENLALRFVRYTVSNRLGAMDSGRLRRLYWLVMVAVSRFILFIWAAGRFDVFIMGGGSSFFRFAEFPVLKLLGRKIIYVLHGTDLRPPYIDGIREASVSEKGQSTRLKSMDSTYPETEEEGFVENNLSYYIHMASKRKRVARWIERYADLIVAPPTIAHFLSKPFVQWLIIGIPGITASGTIPKEGNREGEMITVLHCPSHFNAKGTWLIRKAISSLKERGLPINYVELRGRPNYEVLTAISKCDFIVDQSFSDTPMAGFAMEAAFFCRPAVVGGYYSATIQHDLKKEFIPPSFFCLPEDIEFGIEKLAKDEEFSNELGKQAQDFVSRNWTAREVASKYLRLINGDIPKEWMYDPIHISYLHGMGLSESKSRAIIKAILDKHGVEALQLEDKPVLRDLFVAFAREKTT